ncbi:MAG: DsbA family protein [Anaerolineae bacterium]|nr:DsbA family protein [Anaerolineae bacterium]
MAKTKTSSRSQHRSRRSRQRSQTWLRWGLGGALLLVVVLVAVPSLLSPKSPGSGPREAEWLSGISGYSYDAGETDYLYPNPAGSGTARKWLPALGEADAPVVIIEFSDIFCSHCRNYNLNALPEILDEYVATGKVRYVDHFYGFRRSLEEGAALSTLCAAEQGRYFEYKHALFQSLELGTYNVGRAARVAGIDEDQFDACVQDQRYLDALQEMVFVDNSGVSATPTFLVNGTMISGNDPEGIRRLIDEALAEG